MNRWGIALVQAGLLLAWVPSYAVVKNALIHITVLDAETHSVVIDDSGVPKNCDGINFDAYCHNSVSSQVTNTLLVQEGDNPPFRVACTIDARWSRCVPLPKGQSYDARREKRGIAVYYSDDNGKLRQQFYTYVAAKASVDTATAAAAKSGSSVKAAAATPPAASSDSSSAAPVTESASAGAAAMTPAAEPAPTKSGAAATSPGAATSSVTTTSSSSTQAAPAMPGAGVASATVKCSFSSTPPGAEVTVDGRYVGSTPSVLGLSTGMHTVEVSLQGFAQWKRELTVTEGSELSVNAVLQKAQ